MAFQVNFTKWNTTCLPSAEFSFGDFASHSHKQWINREATRDMTLIVNHYKKNLLHPLSKECVPVDPDIFVDANDIVVGGLEMGNTNFHSELPI